MHLPDDAPVVIDTNSGFHAVGTVLICEDFQILLLLDHDIGEKVLAAYLMVEPWKLLEALNKRITTLNPCIHKIAIDLLEQGPKLSQLKIFPQWQKGNQKFCVNWSKIILWQYGTAGYRKNIYHVTDSQNLCIYSDIFCMNA